jgi:UPF0716 protein FxsA
VSRPGATPYAARGRRRPRVLRWVFLALLVVPIVEIAAIIAVGRVIGGWQTLLLLVVESALGAWIVKREGARTWLALQEALRSGRMPSRQLADAALVLIGGTLLLTPGFVTDILGIVLLLPPTRVLVRGVIARRLLPRLVVSRFGGYGPVPQRGPDGGAPPRRRRPGGGSDVEGTATEIDPPQLR